MVTSRTLHWLADGGLQKASGMPSQGAEWHTGWQALQDELARNLSSYNMMPPSHLLRVILSNYLRHLSSDSKVNVDYYTNPLIREFHAAVNSALRDNKITLQEAANLSQYFLPYLHRQLNIIKPDNPLYRGIDEKWLLATDKTGKADEVAARFLARLGIQPGNIDISKVNFEALNPGPFPQEHPELVSPVAEQEESSAKGNESPTKQIDERLQDVAKSLSNAPTIAAGEPEKSDSTGASEQAEPATISDKESADVNQGTASPSASEPAAPSSEKNIPTEQSEVPQETKNQSTPNASESAAQVPQQQQQQQQQGAGWLSSPWSIAALAGLAALGSYLVYQLFKSRRSDRGASAEENEE